MPGSIFIKYQGKIARQTDACELYSNFYVHEIIKVNESDVETLMMNQLAIILINYNDKIRMDVKSVNNS